MGNKIYTKTGDDGTTGLFGGQRVQKSSLRVNAYGTVDELNSFIGLVRSRETDTELSDILAKLSNLLFIAGSDIATPINESRKVQLDRINADDIKWLENLIDEFSATLPELKNFILPGGSEVSALLQVARAVCRRAERLIVELAEQEETGDDIIMFFNRLSDFLFTAARYVNFISGIDETIWTGR